MSHRVIINNYVASAPGAAATAATPDAVQYSVEYSPSHELTPQQQGQEFARIIKIINKLNDPEAYE